MARKKQTDRGTRSETNSAPPGFTLRHMLCGHSGAISSVAWSPDGLMLTLASDDDTVRLWEASSGRTIRTLEGHAASVYGVAWSPDGRGGSR